MIFGLYLNICMLGSMCEYVPQAYVYPTEAACADDMRQQDLSSPLYTCLPVDSNETPAGAGNAD